MKDASTETTARGRYFRYAVFSLTALLVVTLGIALIPPQPPAPAETPFSERARAAALADALALRAAGQELSVAAAADEGTGSTAAAARVVTLLTIQARALVLPGESGETFPALAAPDPASAKELAAALSASGARRLTDALEADGGMARLLAGAGTAQLLAAEEVAASAGVQAEELPGWQEPAPSAQPTPAIAECTSTRPPQEGEVAGLDMALTAALDSELETVYGYQAALTRLDPAAAARASSLLADHLDLADEAEAYAAMHCAAIPPTQPGYVLDGAFLDAPAAGLARLESGSLTAFGDVVALSTASTRTWAVSALVAAARRTLHWGGDAGAVPGLPLDGVRLPPLPQVPATTASPVPK